MTAWAAPADDVSLSEGMNILQFTENVKNNYISKYPEQADTRILNYCKNDKFRHYIVVEAVDMQAGDITILDPHYDDKYYGRHTISFDEFYKIADNGAGIWLSVYTDKGPQY